MAKKKVTLKVSELEKILSDYHHKECWTKTKEWFGPFGKNIDERSKFLKSIMYTKSPLTKDDAEGVEDFAILQGDLIKTKAAVTNNPLFEFDLTSYSFYVVIPSSCSVQANRYKQVLLARLWPVEELTGQIKEAFLSAIRFENAKLFYFPPVDGETLGQFGFLGVFEEISYIENSLLQSSQRLASLSLIGWHLLNAFLVNHYTRPSSDDLKLRRTDYKENWSFVDG